MIRTQVYLTAGETQGIQALAMQKKRKQSEIIREAIDEYLAKSGAGNKLAGLRAARGIWSDRTITLKELRSDFERF